MKQQKTKALQMKGVPICSFCQPERPELYEKLIDNGIGVFCSKCDRQVYEYA